MGKYVLGVRTVKIKYKVNGVYKYTTIHNATQSRRPVPSSDWQSQQASQDHDNDALATWEIGAGPDVVDDPVVEWVGKWAGLSDCRQTDRQPPE